MVGMIDSGVEEYLWCTIAPWLAIAPMMEPWDELFNNSSQGSNIGAAKRLSVCVWERDEQREYNDDERNRIAMRQEAFRRTEEGGISGDSAKKIRRNQVKSFTCTICGGDGRWGRSVSLALGSLAKRKPTTRLALRLQRATTNSTMAPNDRDQSLLPFELDYDAWKLSTRTKMFSKTPLFRGNSLLAMTSSSKGGAIRFETNTRSCVGGAFGVVNETKLWEKEKNFWFCCLPLFPRDRAFGLEDFIVLQHEWEASLVLRTFWK